MPERLLICTDLDRTLIPNGVQPESSPARERFTRLVSRDEVTLAYVTGRHRALVEKAMHDYRLPRPDFVIGDVGTTLYRVASDDWRADRDWEAGIATDWADRSRTDLAVLLRDLASLRPQESRKQNRFKLSYYVPLHVDRSALSQSITSRLQAHDIRARLVWSVDEPAGVGLLDILPARASKLHAIEALMAAQDFTLADTVFSGDSGNDIEVLASPVSAVLVANAAADVRDEARRLAAAGGHEDRLYLARGGFLDMNGNYAAGVLEGIVHYHPPVADWLDTDEIRSES